MARVIFSRRSEAAKFIADASMVQFGDWQLFHARGQPIVLIFNGASKPEFFYCEARSPLDSGRMYIKLDVWDTILFSDKISTFELYCQIRDLISSSTNEVVWGVLANVFASRMTAPEITMCG